jgi:hypothetical protein
MHRSRLSVLAIFAGVAACSTRDDSSTSEILSQDPTLSATLEVRQKTPPQPLPDACGATAVAPLPAVANRRRAEALARQAYGAELVGNTQEAHSLLRRASRLDGTDESAAYHLGRTSEVLGDRTGAVAAYCRYLTLAPTTAEAVEARQRVATLAQSGTRMAAGSVSIGFPTRRRVASATARRLTRERRPVQPRVAAGTGIEESAPSDGAGILPDVDDRTAAEGDVVATQGRAPTVDQASTASRTQSRGPSRAQSAGIGAVAGAIMGAAMGRSVKSAVIGAAAGGVLGTVVGGASRPAPRGVRPWAAGGRQATGNRSARLPYRRVPAA